MGEFMVREQNNEFNPVARESEDPSDALPNAAYGDGGASGD